MIVYPTIIIIYLTIPSIEVTIPSIASALRLSTQPSLETLWPWKTVHRQPDGLAHGYQPDRPVILNCKTWETTYASRKIWVLSWIVLYTDIPDHKQPASPVTGCTPPLGGRPTCVKQWRMHEIFGPKQEESRSLPHPTTYYYYFLQYFIVK